ncbi:hypothetical protein K3495_g16030, partial [Podosphaera aphanis]
LSETILSETILSETILNEARILTQLQSAVTSIRATQVVYRELHLAPVVALVNNIKNNSSSPNSSVRNKKCAHCIRQGHLREECFLWIDTPDGSKWASKNPEKAKKIRIVQEKARRRKAKRKSNQEKPSGNSDDNKDGVWMMEEHALVSDSSTRNGDVVLDTGATNDIFHDRSLFCSMTPTNTFVHTASGVPIPVSGIGHVKFKIRDYREGKRVKVIEMSNVWYVPSCTKNLVSGIQLDSKGLKISSVGEGLSVMSASDTVIATARPEGGLFCFNTIPPQHIHIFLKVTLMP